MIELRPFLNGDVPLVKEFWNDQATRRHDLAPLSAGLLESTVLSKPYFDREGLILAVEPRAEGDPGPSGARPCSRERIVGLVHAAFRADQSRAAIDPAAGQIAMLLVELRDGRAELADRLLDRAEDYFRGRGVGTVDQGGPRTINPFYAGLLRTNLTLGLSSAATPTRDLLVRRDYAVSQASRLWRRELDGYRLPVSRKLLMLRRAYKVVTETDPAPRSWWEAVTLDMLERTRLTVLDRSDASAGEVSLWWLAPHQRGSAGNVYGLINLEIAPSARRLGLGTLLIGEALAHAHADGADMVDMQIGTDQAEAEAFLTSQAFAPIEDFVFFHKRLA